MVEVNIKISIRSQELIKKYWILCGLKRPNQSLIPSSLNLKSLLSWINKEINTQFINTKKKQQKAEFILVTLRAELMNDLFVLMKGDDTCFKKKKNNSSGIGTMKFSLLTAAGILVAACQGFDGIVTMLSIFTLPAAIILGAGFAFSILSIVVFFGFDLVKVANILGVKLNDAYQLLDVYLLQLQNIKAIRKKIDDYLLTNLSLKDLQQLEQIVSMLQERFSSLTKVSKQFSEALHSEHLKNTKTVISGISALFFFGGGFFAGQSVALFIAGLLMSSAPFWPVIIFSSIVGLAALSIYWYVERPGLNKLVSNWFGLNEDSVEQLCNRDLIAKEERKLVNLKEKVISSEQLTHRILKIEEDSEKSINPTDGALKDEEKSASNIYSFWTSTNTPSQHQEVVDHLSCALA